MRHTAQNILENYFFGPAKIREFVLANDDGWLLTTTMNDGLAGLDFVLRVDGQPDEL